MFNEIHGGMNSFSADPIFVAYHDEEWGVPVHDDRYAQPMLISFVISFNLFSYLKKLTFKTNSITCLSEAVLIRGMVCSSALYTQASVRASCVDRGSSRVRLEFCLEETPDFPVRQSLYSDHIIGCESFSHIDSI